MPTIRIDQDVWTFLQSKAKPFEDSPNDVLRRELGLDILPNQGELQELRRKRESVRVRTVEVSQSPTGTTRIRA